MAEVEGLNREFTVEECHHYVTVLGVLALVNNEDVTVVDVDILHAVSHNTAVKGGFWIVDEFLVYQPFQSKRAPGKSEATRDLYGTDYPDYLSVPAAYFCDHEHLVSSIAANWSFPLWDPIFLMEISEPISMAACPPSYIRPAGDIF